jgi:hypothetical protein
VRRWKTETYPAIREHAAQVGATTYFGDEAGIRADYHSHTTWAPVGRTPVVRSTGKRHSVNMRLYCRRSWVGFMIVRGVVGSIRRG